jgi:hypothetical protein
MNGRLQLFLAKLLLLVALVGFAPQASGDSLPEPIECVSVQARASSRTQRAPASKPDRQERARRPEIDGRIASRPAPDPGRPRSAVSPAQSRAWLEHCALLL